MNTLRFPHIFPHFPKAGIFLLLLSLLLALPLAAQNRRTRVFGIVKDSEGKPIELATIQVKAQGVMTLANLKGEYSLWCESQDSVQVVYSMIGYGTRKRLLINPGDSIRLDVSLLPLTGGTLGTAEVTSVGIQTGTMQRITPKDMKLSPSTTGNAVEELIATQAGVSTHNELSS